MLAERTVVGTLRARCAGVDTTSAQLRLGAQLGSASLRPRGLPPAALLCVRSLDDPLPGTIRLDGMQLGPPAEWERAAEEALEQALRGAARPALGPVPAGAEAVLFADRAELLACLARDALDGTAWTRWWWATVIRASTTGDDPVARAWLEAPAYAPAAFELLARTGHAARYARSLRPAVALELAVRVAKIFAVPDLVRALTGSGAALAVESVPQVDARPGSPEPQDAPAAARPEPLPALAWSDVVPEAGAAGVSVEQELVLAVSLTLARAPALARGQPFARAVARALRLGTARPIAVETPIVAGEPLPPETRRRRVRAGAARADVPAEPESARPRAAVPRLPAASPTRQAVARRPSEAQAARPKDLQAEPDSPRSTAQRTDAAKPEPVPPRPRASARPSTEAQRVPRGAASKLPAPTSRPAKPKAPRRASVALAPTPAPGADVQRTLGAGVETELGGLFFLLNVGLFLGLYGDFTTPDEPGIALDPWDFVALLGMRLLGADAAPDDAAWPLLADLAGRRAHERPGRGFRPPVDWRVPPEWLVPFDPEGEWRWSAASGRLRVEHPAGFPVVAIELRGRDARTVLARELRRYGLRPHLRRARLAAESRVPLRRWADRLAAYAAARIQVALGDPDPAHAVDTVLRRRATVFTTETHVDVTLSLSSLAIEIRLAGLDRDPGWIPAAGRFVAFRFE